MRHLSKLMPLLFCCLALSACASTQTKNTAQKTQKHSAFEVKFVKSEVLSLLYLATSLAGRAPRSNARLLKLYEAHGGSRDVQQQLAHVFRQSPYLIPLYDQKARATRGRWRSLVETLEILAMNASTLHQFGQMSYAVLPISTHTLLMNALYALTPWHKKYIWGPGQERLNRAERALEASSKEIKLNTLLQTIARFYGSAPPRGTFMIGLVPIPGERKLSKGHAIGVYSVLEVIDESDFGPRFEVLIHELCHSLYSAQSIALQKQIEDQFKQSKAPQARVAQQLINEGLATAIGNGWVHQKRYGKLNAKSWYADPVIDRFSRQIYDDVVRYLKQNKTWDNALTQIIIQKVNRHMPNIHLAPRFLFRQTLLLVDAKQLSDQKQWYQHLPGVQQRYTSSPVNHHFSLKAYKKDARHYTPVFVLGEEDVANLSRYPFYAKWKDTLNQAIATGKPFYFADIDKDQRVHVFIGVGAYKAMKPILRQFKAQKPLSTGKVVYLEDTK